MAVMMLMPLAASAAPPPVGSEDWDALQHFTPQQQTWIATQHDRTGRWCCALGDFAFVDVKSVNGKLMVKARHADPARGIPAGWLKVPEDRLVDLRGQQAIPDVIAAWYYQGRVQCLLLGGGF